MSWVAGWYIENGTEWELQKENGTYLLVRPGADPAVRIIDEQEARRIFMKLERKTEQADLIWDK